MKDNKHIEYIQKHGEKFQKLLNLPENPAKHLVHIEKAYPNSFKWKKEHIPFHHACMVMMLAFMEPFKNDIRLEHGTALVLGQWVSQTYQHQRIKSLVPALRQLDLES